MISRSLSGKLFLNAALALFATLALIFGIWTAILHYQPARVTEHGLGETSGQVLDALSFDASGKPISIRLNPNLKYMFDALPLDVLYRVTDEQGNVLMSSDGSHEPLAPQGSPFDASRRTFDETRGGLAVHVLTVPVDRSGRRSYIQVARSERFDTAIHENNRARERQAALGAAVVAMLVFGAVVLYTVNRMLQRLRRVSDAAARIEPHNLTARLDVADVPLEIRPLIESFNSMLERIERGYRAQQEFLATAAHELKTPLALMRGQVELDGSAGSAVLLKDIDLMARQVHQLLHLAEVREVQNYALELLDVTKVVADAVDHLARLTQAREVIVTIERPAREVMIPANRGALFVLMRNLIENAVHHSAPSSVVVVLIDEQGICVRDQGPGIAPEAMPLLFERFWRGSHRRDEGAGLGLSICQEVARAHDWTLAARNGTRGAEFRVVFKPA